MTVDTATEPKCPMLKKKKWSLALLKYHGPWKIHVEPKKCFVFFFHTYFFIVHSTSRKLFKFYNHIPDDMKMCRSYVLMFS